MGRWPSSSDFDRFDHGRLNNNKSRKDLENLGILEHDKRHYYRRYFYKSRFNYTIVLNYTDFEKAFLEKASSTMIFLSFNTSKLSSSCGSNKESLIAKEIKALVQGIIEYMTKEYFTKTTSIKHNHCEKLITFSSTDKQNRDKQYIKEVIYKDHHSKLYRPFYRKNTISLIVVNELLGDIVGIKLKSSIINYYSKVTKIVYCKHNKIEDLDIYLDSITVVLFTLSSIITTTINKELLIDGSVVSVSSKMSEVIYC